MDELTKRQIEVTVDHAADWWVHDANWLLQWFIVGMVFRWIYLLSTCHHRLTDMEKGDTRTAIGWLIVLMPPLILIIPLARLLHRKHGKG